MASLGIPEFAPQSCETTPIYLVRQDEFSSIENLAGEFAAKWAHATGFSGKAGQTLVVPDDNGNIAAVFVGYPCDSDKPAARFFLADVLKRLKSGNYRLVGELSASEWDEAALGALLSQYKYTQFTKGNSTRSARLTVPDGCDGERLLAIAKGEFTTRDLINTPSSNLGPSDLLDHTQRLARSFGAEFSAVNGARLNSEFPLIYAVGAAGRRPCLLDLRWGDSGPKLTLVGKGVCFDTGGLNIKLGRSMELMKKDMGGAAVAIGLSEMIMRLNLPLQLRLLIPAVENSISSASMRPSDIFISRAGYSVEVTNTDAEGRLILADAIDFAEEEKPDLLISLATLTGAARVALGPEIVPFYTDNDHFADILAQSARRVQDPIWRMPLWHGYESMLKSDVADMANAPPSGFAGSITAALFLRRFIKRPENWVHFDLYCWQPKAAPGLPRGGVGQVSRAILEALPEALNC